MDDKPASPTHDSSVGSSNSLVCFGDLQVAHEGDLVAVPAILELLEHQDGRVRLAAVEALGCPGQQGVRAERWEVDEDVGGGRSPNLGSLGKSKGVSCSLQMFLKFSYSYFLGRTEARYPRAT